MGWMAQGFIAIPGASQLPPRFAWPWEELPVRFPFQHTPTPGQGFIANSSNCHNSPKLSKISGWQARFCARFLLR